MSAHGLARDAWWRKTCHTYPGTLIAERGASFALQRTRVQMRTTTETEAWPSTWALGVSRSKRKMWAPSRRFCSTVLGRPRSACCGG